MIILGVSSLRTVVGPPGTPSVGGRVIPITAGSRYRAFSHLIAPPWCCPKKGLQRGSEEPGNFREGGSQGEVVILKRVHAQLLLVILILHVRNMNNVHEVGILTCHYFSYVAKYRVILWWEFNNLINSQ